MKRALDTARYVAKPFDMALVEDHLMREVDLGELENLNEAEAVKKYPDTWARNQDLEDLDFGWPGGETRRDFFARVRQAFQQLPPVGPEQDLVVVSHGGVLSSYLARLLEGRPELWHRYYLDNCSVTTLDLQPDPPHLLEMNDTGHLDGI